MSCTLISLSVGYGDRDLRDVGNLARQSTTDEPSSRLRIALTGGGTGGHVAPIIAVLEAFDDRRIDIEPIWIGSKTGTERETARRAGIPYFAIATGKLRRYVSLRTIPDATRVPIGVVQAARILRRTKPDVVFSTGGYVGVPAVAAARMLKIPSITHEQTAILGLATRINSRFSNTVALSHPAATPPKVRSGLRVVVTGNPVRNTVRGGSPASAAECFDLTDTHPLVYITGGAQGSKAINDTVAVCLTKLLEHAEIIHQTGPNAANGSYDRLISLRDELPASLRRRYHPVEMVGSELRHVYATATLVLSRSGAGTVAELTSLAIPSILVPLPGAVEARENARILEGAGAAVVIEESSLTPARLIETIEHLIEHPGKLNEMKAAAESLPSGEDAAELLVDEIVRLTR